MSRTRKDPVYLGAYHIFTVRPLVPLPLRNTTEQEGPYRAWIFREPGSRQRVRKWLVDVTRRGLDNPCSEIHHPSCRTFPTQREAKAEAQRLAAEEKTIALLKGA